MAVSILTRPEGLVLHHVLSAAITRVLRFQSSPGPKAGCYLPMSLPRLYPEQVSILTRPEGRVLQPPGEVIRPEAAVSILTRPEGRVLREMSCVRSRLPRAFQSSPGPKAGCYVPGIPRSAFVLIVSILTRPEGRVLLA